MLICAIHGNCALRAMMSPRCGGAVFVLYYEKSFLSAINRN
jgi:hypothetical protein